MDERSISLIAQVVKVNIKNYLKKILVTAMSTIYFFFLFISWRDK